MKERQYTIRGVPESLDRELKEQARERGMSLNQLVLDALSRVAGSGGNGGIRHTDLDALAGTWREDAEFDLAVAEFRKVDESEWR